ncbi:hypothetical protein ABZ820_19895 [Streptomyces diacarni]|uniref:Ferritin-like domain-containing protein n=1 Tax=Streptomyces diacarni TaxID=2800381 RepID=A0A367EFJ6_9ACTN|nr:hypothetical protein [Streptomyces diacarni]RCG16848.1 hypothetical protein DTL70_28415 [Streptomyces diacarni]
MHLVTYLHFLHATEETLSTSYRTVSDGHVADGDVHWTTARFARQCTAHAQALAPVLERCGPADEPAPDRLHAQGMTSTRDGPAGLLRDLLDLYQLTNLVDITWTLVRQAASAIRDRDLIHLTQQYGEETKDQLDWLRMRMKAAAPQTLIVAT